MVATTSIKRVTIFFLVLVIFIGSFLSSFSLGPGKPKTSLSIASAQTVDDTTNLMQVKKSVDTDFGGCGLAVECYGAWFIYHIPFSLSNNLASVSGMMLDYFIKYSISRGAYTQSGFMEEGWRIVRDLVNIGFIFVLLYIAFLFILDVGKYNAKKLLIRLLIIATVVNFSLFISKVIVDSSNALSHVFYDQIALEDDENTGSKAIALQIVNKIEPTNMFKAEVADSSGNLVQRNFNGDYGSFIVVYLAVTLLNIGMVWIFFSVALLFIGRVVAIWLYTIFSPIAFLTYATPFSTSDKFQSMGWEAWWKKMLNVAFMAPVFIFLLYLITKFLSIDPPIGSLSNIGSWVMVFVPFVLIWILLKASKDIATKMSGEFAGTLVSWGQRALGGAVGVAAGGTALAARSTISRFTSKTLSDTALQERARAGDKGAQRKLRRANWLTQKSFDFRATGIGKWAAKNYNVQSGFGFLDKPIKSEKKYQEVQTKKAEERSRIYGTTDAYRKAAEEFTKAGGELKNAEKSLSKIQGDLRKVSSELRQLNTVSATLSPAQTSRRAFLQSETRRLVAENNAAQQKVNSATVERDHAEAIKDEATKRISALFGNRALGIIKKIDAGKAGEFEELLKKVAAKEEKGKEDENKT